MTHPFISCSRIRTRIDRSSSILAPPPQNLRIHYSLCAMEERRHILALLSISLAALAASEEVQCDIGTVNSSILADSSVSLYADAGRLYVDFRQPAPCSGDVVGWELCYIVRPGPGPGPSTQNTITAAVLRRDQHTNIQGYRIVEVYSINVIEGARGSSKGLTPVCGFIASEDAVSMERGDFLGFICGERVGIVFNTTLRGQSQSVSNSDHTLKALDISSMQRDPPGGNRASYLLGLNIQDDQFESINNSVTPFLRVIMSKHKISNNANVARYVVYTADMHVTNDTSTTSDPPTTVHPPCMGDGGDLFRNTTFIVVLATASAVILILLVLVFILGCCLCKMKFWCCYKLHSCCGDLFLSCRRKNQGIIATIE